MNHAVRPSHPLRKQMKVKVERLPAPRSPRPPSTAPPISLMPDYGRHLRRPSRPRRPRSRPDDAARTLPVPRGVPQLHPEPLAHQLDSSPHVLGDFLRPDYPTAQIDVRLGPLLSARSRRASPRRHRQLEPSGTATAAGAERKTDRSRSTREVDRVLGHLTVACVFDLQSRPRERSAGAPCGACESDIASLHDLGERETILVRKALVLPVNGHAMPLSIYEFKPDTCECFDSSASSTRRCRNP